MGNPRRGFPGARWRTTNRGFYLVLKTALSSRNLPRLNFAGGHGVPPLRFDKIFGRQNISGFSFLSARIRRASVRTGVHRIRAGSVRYAFLSKAGICLLQFEARTRAAGHTESRCALAHNKSWLLLRNKNNLVLPTSASTVFCRGGSPRPPARFQQR